MVAAGSSGYTPKQLWLRLSRLNQVLGVGSDDAKVLQPVFDAADQIDVLLVGLGKDITGFDKALRVACGALCVSKLTVRSRTHTTRCHAPG